MSNQNSPLDENLENLLKIEFVGTPSIPYRLPGTSSDIYMNIYDRLFRERIIFMFEEIDPDMGNAIVAYMLYLDSEDSSKPIYLYINSPGGEVTAGIAIYDTIQHIKSEVVTICVGLAAGMGALLLASGTPSKRLALPHARIMICRPLGGTGRMQASDIQIEAKYILETRTTISLIMAELTGQSPEKIDEDADFSMSAIEAKEYGLIDTVVDRLDL
jgi:ATP-dependent Clp protease, protease subunit